MCKDLASMGHAPVKDDFYTIVIGSLPPSYNPFILALNAISSAIGSFIIPDDLMQTITDEYDRWTLGRTSKREENVAFYAGDNAGKGKRKQSDAKCYNCGKKGHKKIDCWAEGGGKAGQGGGDGKGKDKDKKKEAAASAREPEAAWMAMTAFSENEDDHTRVADPYPDLQDLLFDDDDNMSVIRMSSTYPPKTRI